MTEEEKKMLLAQQLRDSVNVATDKEIEEEFSPKDFRWGETKFDRSEPENYGDVSTEKPKVYINKKKFAKELGQKELTKEQMNKYILGEALHNLKGVDPERYDRLYRSAMGSPKYRQWLKESYDTTIENPTEDYIEERPIDQWHKESRFDQILGGYIDAGDPDYPTLKNWSRDLPFGSPQPITGRNRFREELDDLVRALRGR
tara:strand:- start:1584 stop:2189 length:606 start_codon:yes stop_codon:yes gene_type:complete